MNTLQQGNKISSKMFLEIAKPLKRNRLMGVKQKHVPNMCHDALFRSQGETCPCSGWEGQTLSSVNHSYTSQSRDCMYESRAGHELQMDASLTRVWCRRCGLKLLHEGLMWHEAAPPHLFLGGKWETTEQNPEEPRYSHGERVWNELGMEPRALELIVFILRKGVSDVTSSW